MKGLGDLVLIYLKRHRRESVVSSHKKDQETLKVKEGLLKGALLWAFDLRIRPLALPGSGCCWPARMEIGWQEGHLTVHLYDRKRNL